MRVRKEKRSERKVLLTFNLSCKFASLQSHGYLGEKYIERVGLGIDGREEERREQQRTRDHGRLQGVIYQPEFANPKLKLEN